MGGGGEGARGGKGREKVTGMRNYEGEGGKGSQGSLFSAGHKDRPVTSFLGCLHLLSLTKPMEEVPSFPKATRKRSRES